MNYISKYKCKYCGKVFTGSITGNERIAFSAIIQACADIKTYDAATVLDKEPHIEPDHYGIGDLIGVEIERGES
ncbi:MAG: hypothetical protein J6S14_14080 [Clostridia bacterium]|nr:hypothetical protein [Clostridia bacterium]